MRRPGLWIVVSVALALALAVSGCGGRDTTAANAYVAATNQAVERFEAAFKALQADVGATSTAAQDARTLGRLRAAVDRTLADFAAARPPADVAALHGRLVGEVRSYRTSIDQAVTGLASAQPRRVSAARVRLAGALRRITASIQATIGDINRVLQA